MITDKGITIIEILIVITIVAFLLLGFFQLSSFSFRVTQHNEKQIKAINLAQEEIEAVRNIRDESWDNISSLAMGADYYPAKSGLPPKWYLSAGSEAINSFNRKVVFENVVRDVNDDIVESGGVNDPNTKKVIATVSWAEGEKTLYVELITYITNWLK